MKNLNHLEAAKIVGTTLYNITQRFDVDLKNIKVNIDDTSGLIYILRISCNKLGHLKFTNDDFGHFCKENNLNGVIFFGVDDIVTLSMTPIIEKESVL